MMRALARKIAAAATAVSVLIGSLPMAAFAQAGSSAAINPRDAMNFLRMYGMFSDPKNSERELPNLRSCFENDSGLTEFGEKVYSEILKEHPDMNETSIRGAVRDLRDQLYGIVHDDTYYTPKQAAAIHQALKTAAKLNESVQVSAMLGALAQTPNEKPGMQVPTGQKDVFVIVDAAGNKTLKVRRTEDGGSIVEGNAELAEKQKRINKAHLPGVPFIQPNGIMSYEMLTYQYFFDAQQLREKTDASVRSKITYMAELLGKSADFEQDQFAYNQDLIDSIQALGEKTRDKHGYLISDMVELRFAPQERELREASNALAEYKGQLDQIVKRLGSQGVFTDPMQQNLKKYEDKVQKYFQELQLSEFSHMAREQRQQIDPNSMDSDQVTEAIKDLDLPLADGESNTDNIKDLYNYQRTKAAEEGLTLKNQVENLRADLKATDGKDKKKIELIDARISEMERRFQHLVLQWEVIQSAPRLAKAGQDLHWGKLNFGGAVVRGIVYAMSPSYRENSEIAAQETETWQEVFRQIANGHRDAAEGMIVALHPNAVSEIGHAPGADDPKGGAGEALEASMHISESRLQDIQETNNFINAVGGAITLGVSMAVGGPLLRKIFNGAARFIAPARAPTKGIWATRFIVDIFREVFRHWGAMIKGFSPRVNQMWFKGPEVRGALANGVRGPKVVVKGFRGSPVMHTLEFRTRLGLKAMRQYTVFSAFSMVIMGTYGVYEHLKESSWIGFASPYDGMGDAFYKNAKGALEWQGESWWRPYLMFINNPASAWTSVRFNVLGRRVNIAAFMEFNGQYGFVGSALALIRKMSRSRMAMATMRKFGYEPLPVSDALTRRMEKGLLERMNNWGRTTPFKPVVSFTTGFLAQADKMAQFGVYDKGFAMFQRWRGRNFGPWDDDGTEESDERIQRGQYGYERSFANNFYWWIFLPNAGAHTGEGMAQYHEWKPRIDEIHRQGNLHLLMKANGDKPIITDAAPVPLMLSLTVGRGDPDEMNQLMQTPEARRYVWGLHIRDALGEEGQAKAEDVNPLELDNYLKLDDGKVVFGYKMGPEMREAIKTLQIESLIANESRTVAILTAAPGAALPDVGVIEPEFKERVAKAILNAPAEIAERIPKRLTKAVEIVLEEELSATDLLFKGVGPEFEKALGKALPSRSNYREKKDDAIKAIKAWAKRVGQGHVESYRPVFAALRKKWEAELQANPNAEGTRRALAVVEYMQRDDDHFNSFNNWPHVEKKIKKILEGLDARFKAKPDSQAIVDQMRKITEQLQHDQNSPAPGSDPAFEAMHKSLQTLLDALPDSPDKKVLLAAAKQIELAPWKMRDKTNRIAMKEWKKEQVIAISDVLFGAAGSAGGNANFRMLELVKTSGGKTLLQILGLLPWLMARAAARGKELIIVTQRKDLIIQFLEDKDGLNMVGINVRIMDFGDLKSEAAQAELRGVDFTKNKIIMGDEADISALEAALSIGSDTGKVWRLWGGNRVIKNQEESIGGVIAAARNRFNNRLRGELNRMTIAARNVPGVTDEEMVKLTTELAKANEKISEAQGKVAHAYARADADAVAARIEARVGEITAAGGLNKLQENAAGRLTKAVQDYRKTLKNPDDFAQKRSVLKKLQSKDNRQENLIAVAGDELTLGMTVAQALERVEILRAGLNRDALDAWVEAEILDHLLSRVGQGEGMVPTTEQSAELEKAHSVVAALRAQADAANPGIEDTYTAGHKLRQVFAKYETSKVRQKNGKVKVTKVERRTFDQTGQGMKSMMLEIDSRMRDLEMRAEGLERTRTLIDLDAEAAGESLQEVQDQLASLEEQALIAPTDAQRRVAAERRDAFLEREQTLVKALPEPLASVAQARKTAAQELVQAQAALRKAEAVRNRAQASSAVLADLRLKRDAARARVRDLTEKLSLRSPENLKVLQNKKAKLRMRETAMQVAADKNDGLVPREGPDDQNIPEDDQAKQDEIAELESRLQDYKSLLTLEERDLATAREEALVAFEQAKDAFEAAAADYQIRLDALNFRSEGPPTEEKLANEAALSREAGDQLADQEAKRREMDRARGEVERASEKLTDAMNRQGHATLPELVRRIEADRVEIQNLRIAADGARQNAARYSARGTNADNQLAEVESSFAKNADDRADTLEKRRDENIHRGLVFQRAIFKRMSQRIEAEFEKGKFDADDLVREMMQERAKLVHEFTSTEDAQHAVWGEGYDVAKRVFNDPRLLSEGRVIDLESFMKIPPDVRALIKQRTGRDPAPRRVLEAGDFVAPEYKNVLSWIENLEPVKIVARDAQMRIIDGPSGSARMTFGKMLSLWANALFNGGGFVVDRNAVKAVSYEGVGKGAPSELAQDYEKIRAQVQARTGRAISEGMTLNPRDFSGPEYRDPSRAIDTQRWVESLPTNQKIYEAGKNRFAPTLRLVWQVFRGKPITVGYESAGLARWFAAKWLVALKKDTFMPVHERDILAHLLWRSLLFPTWGAQSGSYARREIISIINGVRVGSEKFRIDQKNKAVFTMFAGTRNERMDNDERRYLEFINDFDVTLRFENESITTVNSLIKKTTEFLFLSGTAPKQWRDQLEKKHGALIGGEGSEMPTRSEAIVTGDFENNYSNLPDDIRKKIEDDHVRFGGQELVLRDLQPDVEEALRAHGFNIDERVTDLTQIFMGQSEGKIAGFIASKIEANDTDQCLVFDIAKEYDSIRKNDPRNADNLIHIMQLYMTDPARAVMAKPAQEGKGKVSIQLDNGAFDDGIITTLQNNKKKYAVDDADIESVKNWLTSISKKQTQKSAVMLTAPNGVVLAQYLNAIKGRYIEWMLSKRRQTPEYRGLDAEGRKIDEAQFTRKAAKHFDQATALMSGDPAYLKTIPDANVKAQMNLDALRDGGILFAINREAAARGTNPEWKGENAVIPKDPLMALQTEPHAGYSRIYNIHIDMQDSTGPEVVQADGRDDTGRIIPNTRVERWAVVNMRTLQDKPFIQDLMLGRLNALSNPEFFSEIIASAEFREYMRSIYGKAAKNMQPDRAMVQKFVDRPEFANNPLAPKYQALAHRDADFFQRVIDMPEFKIYLSVLEEQRQRTLVDMYAKSLPKVSVDRRGVERVNVLRKRFDDKTEDDDLITEIEQSRDFEDFKRARPLSGGDDVVIDFRMFDEYMRIQHKIDPDNPMYDEYLKNVADAIKFEQNNISLDRLRQSQVLEGGVDPYANYGPPVFR